MCHSRLVLRPPTSISSRNGILLGACFLWLAAASAWAGFTFSNFVLVGGLALNGVATNSGSVLRLSSPERQGAGSAWYTAPQDISAGFTTTFDFRITPAPGSPGGDGLVLVIQAAGTTAIGLPGRGIGYSGIPKSVAIEWDTWYNGADGNYDPSDNHIGVLTRGEYVNTDDHRWALGSVTDYLHRFNDAQIHHVTVQYQPGLLRIWSDAQGAAPSLEVGLNIADLIGSTNGMAWVGFSSATGFGLEAHDILNWSFDTGKPPWPSFSYFPALRNPGSLLVAKTWSDGGVPPIVLSADANTARAELILLESLAGLLLKQSNHMGIFIEANSDHRAILQDLSSRRGIPFTYVSAPASVWTFLDLFKTNIASYTRCSIGQNPDSLNVARMAAYRFNALIVDALLENKAQAHSLTNAFDASDKNDDWFHTNWWPAWPTKTLAVEQNNNPALAADYACLNDYPAATGVPVFFDGSETPLRDAFLSELAPDSVLLGWPQFDELSFTSFNSQHNVSLAAANWCFDLALLSSLRDPSKVPYSQATCPGAQPFETNVHYVTFVFTDGDNVQWFHNGFLLNQQWWGSPSRGSVPLGWGMSPTLRDLSPTLVEKLFSDAAVSRPALDVFCAMSPIGYCYPSMMSAQTRALNGFRLGQYMRDLGLRILIVLDNSGFENPVVYDPYLLQDSIDAIFYWDAFGNYAKYGGAVCWQKQKPIISAFTTLWGANGPAQVAAALNQRPRTPQTTDGYSMVAVHAWSHTVEDVLQCAALLAPDVRVVTPDIFVNFIRRHANPYQQNAALGLDYGDSLRAPYVPGSGAISVNPGSTTQSVDGSPSTQFVFSPQYAFCNMGFPPTVAFEPETSRLEYDLWGDGSGCRIRLELWSSAYQAFLYVDTDLNFAGWHHFSYSLDCTDGLQVWNATPQEVASCITIWQVSGSWNGLAGTCYLDNVQLTSPLRASPSPAPQLAISRTGPSQVTLAWAADFRDFQIERTADLAAHWQLLDVPVLTTNCQCSVTIAPTNLHQFFRLKGQ